MSPRKNDLIAMLQNIPGNPTLLVVDELNLQHSINGWRQGDIDLALLEIFKGLPSIEAQEV